MRRVSQSEGKQVSVVNAPELHVRIARFLVKLPLSVCPTMQMIVRSLSSDDFECNLPLLLILLLFLQALIKAIATVVSYSSNCKNGDAFRPSIRF